MLIRKHTTLSISFLHSKNLPTMALVESIPIAATGRQSLRLAADKLPIFLDSGCHMQKLAVLDIAGNMISSFRLAQAFLPSRTCYFMYLSYQGAGVSLKPDQLWIQTRAFPKLCKIRKHRGPTSGTYLHTGVVSNKKSHISF